MYAAFLFLYFFNDLDGAVYTGLIFCIITLVGSLISRHFDTLWYGIGLVAGAFTGWTYAYFRLSWLESHLHIHIFCKGSLNVSGMFYILPESPDLHPWLFFQ